MTLRTNEGYLYSTNTSSVFPDIGRPLRYQAGVLYKPLNGLSVASKNFYSTTVVEIDPDVTPTPTHLLLSLEELQDSFMEVQLGHHTQTVLEIRFGTLASTFHPPDQTIRLTTGNFTGSYLIPMKYTRRFICGRNGSEFRRPFSVSVSLRVLGMMKEVNIRKSSGRKKFGLDEIERRVKSVQYPLTAALSVRTFSSHEWSAVKYLEGVCNELDEWFRESSFGLLRTVEEEVRVAKAVMVGASVFDNRRSPTTGVDVGTRELMEDWRLTPFAIEPLIAQVVEGFSGGALTSCMTIGEMESFGAVGVVSLVSLGPAEEVKVCLISRSLAAVQKPFSHWQMTGDLSFAKKVLTAPPSVGALWENGSLFSLYKDRPWLVNPKHPYCPLESSPRQSPRTSDILCTDVLPKSTAGGRSKTVIGWPLLWSTNEGLYEVQQLLVNASSGAQLTSLDAAQALVIAPVQGCFQNCHSRGYCRSELLPGSFLRHSCRCLPGYTGAACELQATGASHHLQLTALLLTNLFVLLPAWLCLHLLCRQFYLYRRPISTTPPLLKTVLTTHLPTSANAPTVSTDDDQTTSFPPLVSSNDSRHKTASFPPLVSSRHKDRPPFVVVPQAPISFTNDNLHYSLCSRDSDYNDLVDRTDSQPPAFDDQDSNHHRRSPVEGDFDHRCRSPVKGGFDHRRRSPVVVQLVERGESLCVSLVPDNAGEESKKIESETVEIDEQDFEEIMRKGGFERALPGSAVCKWGLTCPLLGHSGHSWLLCPLFGQQIHLVLLLLVLLNVGLWSTAYHACETGGRCFVPSRMDIHSVRQGLIDPTSLTYLFSGGRKPGLLTPVTGTLFEQSETLLDPNCSDRNLAACKQSSSLTRQTLNAHVHHLDTYKSTDTPPMQPYQQTNYLQFKVKWSHLHDIDKFFAYWAFYVTMIPLGRFNLLVNSLLSIGSGLAVGYRVVHHSSFVEWRMIQWSGLELCVLLLICGSNAWWFGRLPCQGKAVGDCKLGGRSWATLGLLGLGLIFCCLAWIGWELSRSVFFPYWLSHSFWHISILSSPTFFIYAFNLLDS